MSRKTDSTYQHMPMDALHVRITCEFEMSLCNARARARPASPVSCTMYRDHVLFLHHMSDSTIGLTPQFPHKPYGLPWPLLVPVALQLS